MNKYLLATLMISVSLPAAAQTFYRNKPQTPAVSSQTNAAPSAVSASQPTTEDNDRKNSQEIIEKADSVYASTVKTAKLKTETEREYDKNLEETAQRADIPERLETVRNLNALKDRHPGFAQGEENVDVNNTEAYKNFIKTKMTPPKDLED